MDKRLLPFAVALALVGAACGSQAADEANLESGDSGSTTTALGVTSTIQPSSETDEKEPDPQQGVWIMVDEPAPDPSPDPTDQTSTLPAEQDGPTTTVPADDSEDAKQPLPSTTTSSTPPAIGAVPPSLVAAILADASTRSGTSDVSLIRAQAVVWNDGSFGCPSPGQMYTQALVNGYWIVVGADGHEYDYRASYQGYFKLCVGGGAEPHAVDR